MQNEHGELFLSENENKNIKGFSREQMFSVFFYCYFAEQLGVIEAHKKIFKGIENIYEKLEKELDEYTEKISSNQKKEKLAEKINQFLISDFEEWSKSKYKVTIFLKPKEIIKIFNSKKTKEVKKVLLNFCDKKNFYKNNTKYKQYTHAQYVESLQPFFKKAFSEVTHTARLDNASSITSFYRNNHDITQPTLSGYVTSSNIDSNYSSYNNVSACYFPHIDLLSKTKLFNNKSIVELACTDGDKNGNEDGDFIKKYLEFTDSEWNCFQELSKATRATKIELDSKARQIVFYDFNKKEYYNFTLLSSIQIIEKIRRSNPFFINGCKISSKRRVITSNGGNIYKGFQGNHKVLKGIPFTLKKRTQIDKHIYKNFFNSFYFRKNSEFYKEIFQTLHKNFNRNIPDNKKNTIRKANTFINIYKCIIKQPVVEILQNKNSGWSKNDKYIKLTKLEKKWLDPNNDNYKKITKDELETLSLDIYQCINKMYNQFQKKILKIKRENCIDLNIDFPDTKKKILKAIFEELQEI